MRSDLPVGGYVLGLAELVDALGGALAAQPGLLSCRRRERPGPDRTPRLRPTMPASMRSLTLRPLARFWVKTYPMRPISVSLARGDHRVGVVEGDHRRHRAEYLFAGDGRRGVHAGQHGGLVEEARTLHRTAAGHRAGAVSQSPLHQAVDAGDRAGV